MCNQNNFHIPRKVYDPIESFSENKKQLHLTCSIKSNQIEVELGRLWKEIEGSQQFHVFVLCCYVRLYVCRGYFIRLHYPSNARWRWRTAAAAASWHGMALHVSKSMM